MRKVVAPITLLLAAIVHAPLPAQARLFELLPYPIATSEPVILLLTGLALLSLSRFGSHRSRLRDDGAVVSNVRPLAATPATRADQATPSQRAA